MNYYKKGQEEERDHLHQGDHLSKTVMPGRRGLRMLRQPVLLENKREAGRKEGQRGRKIWRG